MADFAGPGDGAVVLRRADDDMRVIRKPAEHLLVAAAVLQRHQIGISADQRAVRLQRRLALHRLDEQDHQIGRRHAARVARDARPIDGGASVRLGDAQAIRPNFRDAVGVSFYHRHVVVPTQIAAVQRAHRAAANHRNFHVCPASLVICIGCNNPSQWRSSRPS